jgi:hypothetical protein
MQMRTLLFTFLLLVPATAPANDGFGGLGAIGLQFGKSTAIRMVAEDLYVSPREVRVRSVFRNEGKEEVRGEVIFPLPPISLSELGNSGFALAEKDLDRDNVVDFKVRVNGAAIEVRTERIAVLEPPFDERRKASARYDSPGEEVTALLKGYGIPLSLDLGQVAAALARLPHPAKETLKARGLADFFADEPPAPLWSIIERYHWPQTFAARREVRIEHRYNPAPPGGIFIWPDQEAELDTSHRHLIDTYCIDAATRQAIKLRLHPAAGAEFSGTGMALYLDYVLTTANTWNGPIGTFHLTIDKGHPRNILSLCIDGLRKTGPTTFEMEKKEFRPDQDLRLLIVTGLEGQL